MSKAEIISEIPKLSHADRHEIMRVIFECDRKESKEREPRVRFVKEDGFTVIETGRPIDEKALKKALAEFP